jgi:glycosyltransferase involved in cell wall biosynthesis
MSVPGAPDDTLKRGGVAAVVIGRNEGERLKRCLQSIVGRLRAVVYVDSGSTDGSVAFAEQIGAHVLALNDAKPFTAARARNAGFDFLMEREQGLVAVQFVDGDCEVEEGWLSAASTFLEAHPEAAVVFGRRRERFPERSVYNRLCDIEWSIPPGEVDSCGGDAMMRVIAVQEVGGYRPDIIAGEEPELCLRLRERGWKVFCIDHPMTLHDAAMTRFGQWWRRSMRAGYSFILGSHLHGRAPEYHRVAETRRAWLWGVGIPLAIAAAALLFGSSALVLLLIYPIQVLRLYFKRRGKTPMPFTTSFFHVLGRFPEAMGQLKFLVDRTLGRQAALIEYK